MRVAQNACRVVFLPSTGHDDKVDALGMRGRVYVARTAPSEDWPKPTEPPGAALRQCDLCVTWTALDEMNQDTEDRFGKGHASDRTRQGISCQPFGPTPGLTLPGHEDRLEFIVAVGLITDIVLGPKTELVKVTAEHPAAVP